MVSEDVAERNICIEGIIQAKELVTCLPGKSTSREGQGQTQPKGYLSRNKLDRMAVVGIMLEEETSQSSLSFMGPMN